MKIFKGLLIFLISGLSVAGQDIKWDKSGNAYFKIENGGIVKYTLPGQERTEILNSKQLIPSGTREPLPIDYFEFSPSEKTILIYTNSQKVWRQNTRGDYWVYDIQKNHLKQLGKGLAEASMMFAKFSPLSNSVAYVSQYNIYVENLENGVKTQLTKNGTRKLINGTFDWAYEEEFFCRDGFRWNTEGTKIAYWQIDAHGTKDYLMINNTEGIYPKNVPVEYPVAGESPSKYKIGVVDVRSKNSKWMQLPTDAILGSYVPRMEWIPKTDQLILQHLNRKQNHSNIIVCNASTGVSKSIYSEKEEAWIDILPLVDEDYANGGWDWLENGKSFLWISEKDGWRHAYSISLDGKSEKLITAGNFDIMDIVAIDANNGYLYFHASPTNATQKYLFRSKLDGTGTAERLSPENQIGTHNYTLSPSAQYAQHSFSNHFTPNTSEWVSLPKHQSLGENKVEKAVKAAAKKVNLSFEKISSSEGVEMDAWIQKPSNFDATKKYPIVFYVYTEPWGQNVKDQYRVSNNYLYNGDMAADGYIYVSIDNRGTPVPKGRAWRKSVYRKIGQVNIKDQALAAKEILKRPYVDSSRVAVWGWSGGGSATLNLMFQYPEIYKTGISIAAVGNQLTYDNIYQERYMGLPQENRKDFIDGSPITYAKNLKGNLLYIHGTGDDNVHYNNAEMLIDELVKHGKSFQLMAYPNRSHRINEGEGTWEHLKDLYTKYLKTHCPPGGR
jgi:dipeptidyl-peptidase 4